MRKPIFTLSIVALPFMALLVVLAVAPQSQSQTTDAPKEKNKTTNTTADAKTATQTVGTTLETTAKTDDDLVALNPKRTVLLDRTGKRLLLKTTVCMDNGLLEMLVCQAGTKEHESILSIDSKSYIVHAGLLALGAKVGKPVEFVPEFAPPTGEELDIFVTWKDKRGKVQRKPVNQWIRHSIYRYFEFPLKKLPDGFELPKDDDLRYDELNEVLLWFGPMKTEKRDELLKLSDDAEYKKGIRYFYKNGQSRPMQARFIFAGSSFYVDEDTNKRLYRGEGGYLICVANFPSATIDIAIESSAEGEGQMFEAWTERLPAKGTEVTVELIPRGFYAGEPKTKTGAKAKLPFDAVAPKSVD